MKNSNNPFNSISLLKIKFQKKKEEDDKKNKSEERQRNNIILASEEMKKDLMEVKHVAYKSKNNKKSKRHDKDEFK
jgi:hypothetical protein